MRLWEVTGPVRQKGGAERVETQLVRSSEQPVPGAIDRTEQAETEQMRTALLQRVKRLKSDRLFSPLPVPQGLLQIDRESRGWLSETVQAGEAFEATGGTFITAWRMADDAMVPVDLPLMRGWLLLIAAHTQKTVDRHAELHAEITTAPRTRLEELQSEISQGWDIAPSEQE